MRFVLEYGKSIGAVNFPGFAKPKQAVHLHSIAPELTAHVVANVDLLRVKSEVTLIGFIYKSQFDQLLRTALH